MWRPHPSSKLVVAAYQQYGFNSFAVFWWHAPSHLCVWGTEERCNRHRVKDGVYSTGNLEHALARRTNGGISAVMRPAPRATLATYQYQLLCHRTKVLSM